MPPRSQAKRRADYVLEPEPGLPLAVIEAKRLWASASDGIQQGVRYATKLAAPRAYSTNGRGWIEHDLLAGTQRTITHLPMPVEVWAALIEQRGLGAESQSYLTMPFNRQLTNVDGSVRSLRPYQQRAVHEVLVAMAAGRRRLLVVMATGAGKTFTALQLVWKLREFRRRQQETVDLPN